MYTLTKSPVSGKKYRIITPASKGGKVIDFGARGYEDYTMHKDDKRKASYIARHRPRENWTATGINTAGFWSLWLLWNKKTIIGSIKNIEDTFNIKIKYQK